MICSIDLRMVRLGAEKGTKRTLNQWEGEGGAGKQIKHLFFWWEW